MTDESITEFYNRKFSKEYGTDAVYLNLDLAHYHQRINGKMVPISLKQKRKWVRVAACVAQTMNKIASNIDEQEIQAQLNELERLVNEANANPKDGKPKTI